jgi:hypothetical protein
LVGCAAALCLLVAACSSIVEQSDGGPEEADYVPGAVYVLLHDRYLEYLGWPVGIGRPVVVASSVSYVPGTGPSSIEEYQTDPARWSHIAGVLPAGTRLRFQRIERHRYPMLEDWFEAYAVVEDGEFRGRAVDLTRISAQVPNSRMLRSDPGELRLSTADTDRTQVR